MLLTMGELNVRCVPEADVEDVIPSLHDVTDDCMPPAMSGMLKEVNDTSNTKPAFRSLRTVSRLLRLHLPFCIRPWPSGPERLAVRQSLVALPVSAVGLDDLATPGIRRGPCSGSWLCEKLPRTINRPHTERSQSITVLQPNDIMQFS